MTADEQRRFNVLLNAVLLAAAKVKCICRGSPDWEGYIDCPPCSCMRAIRAAVAEDASYRDYVACCRHDYDGLDVAQCRVADGDCDCPACKCQAILAAGA